VQVSGTNLLCHRQWYRFQVFVVLDGIEITTSRH
jgi:hypothetical protein